MSPSCYVNVLLPQVQLQQQHAAAAARAATRRSRKELTWVHRPTNNCQLCGVSFSEDFSVHVKTLLHKKNDRLKQRVEMQYQAGRSRVCVGWLVCVCVCVCSLASPVSTVVRVRAHNRVAADVRRFTFTCVLEERWWRFS